MREIIHFKKLEEHSNHLFALHVCYFADDWAGVMPLIDVFQFFQLES